MRPGERSKEATAASYMHELKPLVYPNKHMSSPIKTDAESRHAGSAGLESQYGRQLMAAREKEVPLEVDYRRLLKTQLNACECEITSLELEKTETEVKRRNEERAFEARSLYTQTTMKVPGGRPEARYGDEYTPLHYDRQFKAHDEEVGAFYRRALRDGQKEQGPSVGDTISEPLVKKKR